MSTDTRNTYMFTSGKAPHSGGMEPSRKFLDRSLQSAKKEESEL